MESSLDPVPFFVERKKDMGVSLRIIGPKQFRDRVCISMSFFTVFLYDNSDIVIIFH
jgi:hypothetical protein